METGGRGLGRLVTGAEAAGAADGVAGKGASQRRSRRCNKISIINGVLSMHSLYVFVCERNGYETCRIAHRKLSRVVLKV